MDVGAISNNSLEVQSLLMNGANKSIGANNNNDKTTKTAEYAKKGEPMYMAEMDADGDGTVTVDEYREYCKSKGINTKQMMKMSQLASTYRTMKAESEAMDYISKLTPNVHPNLKTNNESVYARQGDSKYNPAMDINRDKSISYKEYMEYCQKNSASHGLKANTKYDESEDGNLKITNLGKAIESYEKNEKHAEGMFEVMV